MAAASQRAVIEPSKSGARFIAAHQLQQASTGSRPNAAGRRAQLVALKRTSTRDGARAQWFKESWPDSPESGRPASGLEAQSAPPIRRWYAARQSKTGSHPWNTPALARRTGSLDQLVRNCARLKVEVLNLKRIDATRPNLVGAKRPHNLPFHYKSGRRIKANERITSYQRVQKKRESVVVSLTKINGSSAISASQDQLFGFRLKP